MLIANGVIISGGGTTFSTGRPSGSSEFTIPGYYIWRPPVDVSFVDITVIGAGGGGMGYISHPTYVGRFAGGGGGGLGFVSNYPVNSNNVYYIKVGQGGDTGYYTFPGGPGTSGGTGDDTGFNTTNTFNSSSIITMYGAGGGKFPPFVPGSTNAGGGGASGWLNWRSVYSYIGGAGQAGAASPTNNNGSQGGDAASHTGNGGNGTNLQNVPGQGSYLYGPSVSPASPPTWKVRYGAGGGGAGTNGGSRTATAGDPGAVRISWGPANYSLYPRPSEIILLDFLVVAGGGGGGGPQFGGGGGAGGYIQDAARITAVGDTYTVIVGAGGTEAVTTPSSPGGDSSWFSNVAIGGGRGGGNFNAVAGQTGGSAGGSAAWSSPQSPTTRGVSSRAGTSGQGNAGGGGEFDQNMGPAQLFGYTAGGGGGAGAAGLWNISNPYPYGPGGSIPSNGRARGGAGGIGRQSNITGNVLYYAGGGGGAGSNVGFGGAGGGGDGGLVYTPTTGTHGANAAVNTGGGGGGGAFNTPTGSSRGGAGGSGVVIISQYASNVLPTVTGSPNVIYNGDKIVYKFWQSGTIQW